MMESLIVWKQCLKQKTLLFCETSLAVKRLHLFFCSGFHVYMTQINHILFLSSDLSLQRNSAIWLRSHFFKYKPVSTKYTCVVLFFSATSVLSPFCKIFHSVPTFKIWYLMNRILNCTFNFCPAWRYVFMCLQISKQVRNFFFKQTGFWQTVYMHYNNNVSLEMLCLAYWLRFLWIGSFLYNLNTYQMTSYI